MTNSGRKSEVFSDIINLKDNPELLALYAHIAEVRRNFPDLSCHIYTGNQTHGIPRIKYKNKMMRMADFYAPFFGLPTGGKKQCTTPGCFNPYHYVFDPVSKVSQSETPLHRDDGVDDLISYVIETQQLRKDQINFSHLRTLLDIHDVTDQQLQRYLDAQPISA